VVSSIRVPVYLPDQTKIGTAQVNVERGTAVISIQADSDLMELMVEDLIAISIMYLAKDRVHEIKEAHIIERGEKSDGTST
jgi:hypothetical protein